RRSFRTTPKRSRSRASFVEYRPENTANRLDIGVTSHGRLLIQPYGHVIILKQTALPIFEQQSSPGTHFIWHCEQLAAQVCPKHGMLSQHCVAKDGTLPGHPP